MRGWDAQRVAGAAGAEVVRAAPGGDGPARAVIDTREAGAGDLFVGLRGERADGGRFAPQALAAGAWGVLVALEHASAALAAGVEGAVLAAADPLEALGRLATAWRRELGARVIGVTGSVGKTSTKDLIAALLRGHRAVWANQANWNTEIGLPLTVLAAPAGTDVLVLEMGMRGFGQIELLARIAEPDVGVVTLVGPVHLEQVGSLDGVARAKGELLRALPPGGTAVIPAGEARLDPHVPADVAVVRFGDDGDVRLEAFAAPHATVSARGRRLELEVPFTARHQLANLLAAVAAAQAVGVEPEGRVDVAFSALRGERILLASGAVVVNDCYNANPLSMRAALDDLATQEPEGRRIAVLGDMLELGAEEAEAHREAGAHARASRVDALIAVGPRSAAMADAFGPGARHAADAAEAAELAAGLVEPGDVVLVKASRGVGLEVVAEALQARESAARG